MNYIDEVYPPSDVVTMETNSDSMTDNECASNILRQHYFTLSQTITKPKLVALSLYEQCLIVTDDNTLKCIQTVPMLLKVVRKAVHDDHRNLDYFANILQRNFAVDVCSLILNEYGNK